MSSMRRSSYKNVEFGFQYTTGTTCRDERDVRPLDWAERFQRVLELFRRDAAAVIEPNAYAACGATDVPHRLFARGHIMLTPRCARSASSLRTGLPYSVVDERRFRGNRATTSGAESHARDSAWSTASRLASSSRGIGVLANNAFDTFSARQNLVASSGPCTSSPYGNSGLQIDSSLERFLIGS